MLGNGPSGDHGGEKTVGAGRYADARGGVGDERIAAFAREGSIGIACDRNHPCAARAGHHSGLDGARDPAGVGNGNDEIAGTNERRAVAGELERLVRFGGKAGPLAERECRGETGLMGIAAAHEMHALDGSDGFGGDQIVEALTKRGPERIGERGLRDDLALHLVEGVGHG